MNPGPYDLLSFAVAVALFTALGDQSPRAKLVASTRGQKLDSARPPEGLLIQPSTCPTALRTTLRYQGAYVKNLFLVQIGYNSVLVNLP